MEKSILFSSCQADKKEFSRMVQEAVLAINDSVNDKKAYTGPEPLKLKEEILSYDILPEKGLGFDSTLEKVKKAILPNFLRTSSTDYMAHLHSPALLESIISELILSTFNQSMDSWDQSPVATETEIATIKKLCSLFGYSSDSDGTFTSGGSQSNLTALLLARDKICKNKFNHDVKKHGLPAEYKNFRLYTSEISHFSMEKSCHLMGLGYDAVVKVPVLDNMKMDTKALEALLKKDFESGKTPFCIVATIGTTDYGSIDNVEELRQLADKYGCYLHADAAYGSGLIMSKKYRSRAGNLSLCDSITVDFHKMFLLPVSCSAVLAKDANDFEALELHADYLNREEDEEDGYTNLVGKSLQTTRRFDALKVWMAFQCQGRDGYENIINTAVENAAYVYSKIKEDSDFEALCQPEISSVVFRFKGNFDDEDADEINKKIRRALIHQKGIVIGQTVYRNRTCLKLTLLNPLICHKNLDEILFTIKELEKELVK